MRIYLVRHGETEYNRLNIVQGGGIDASLNETGRQQAKSLFKAYEKVNFDALYTSGLKRTKETLQPFSEVGYQLNQLDGFNELNWGVFEGKKASFELKDEFRRITRAWSEGDLHAKFEGGESPLEGWKRASEALAYIFQHHTADKTVLICTHGRMLRIMLSQLLGYGLKNMQKFDHHNTGVNILKRQTAEIYIAETLNNIEHLAL